MRANPRLRLTQILWLAAVPSMLIVSGSLSRELGWFSDATNYVRGHQIPDVLFKSGRTTKELRLLDFGSVTTIRAARFASELPMDQWPSSVAVDSAAAKNDGPIMSIVVDDDDLHHPRTGLLTNPMERGRKWERLAYVSYLENGELLFAGGAGLRVHGGVSRSTDIKSFRLHFRDIYGTSQFPQGILFGGNGDPIKSIVVHRNIFRDRTADGSLIDWYFTNPLAFEIVRQVGGIAPETQPVQLYLNGEYAGPYVLTEHISIDFLRARFGNGDFTYGRGKPKPLPRRTVNYGDPNALHELYSDLEAINQPLAIDSVGKKIDLENMTSWFISILISGVTDAFQGAILKDSSSPEARWFWINWDMDNAFKDPYSLAPAERPWEIDLFSGPQSILRRGYIRGLIFSRLSRESPEFKRYFLRRFVDALNHQATVTFILGRATYYEKIAESFGISDVAYVAATKKYVEKRPAVLREQIAHYFDVGQAHRLMVTGPDSFDLIIDGHDVSGTYVGWYYKETPANIQIPKKYQDQAIGWVINGERLQIKESSVNLTIDSDLIVEVVPLEL